MVKVIKKLNKISKIKVSKTRSVAGIDLTIDVQLSVTPCHLEDSIIPGVPFLPCINHDDFIKVNGDNVHYTYEEIENLLSSSEVKNLIMKEIVRKVIAS